MVFFSLYFILPTLYFFFIMTFQTILTRYRKDAFSERDKGARFERLMQAYLKTDPKYAYLFKKVWLWNEFPGRGDLGGGDTGIDLVALTLDGDYWAIQCKCFQESASIDKPAVDSFLSTSSREFKDENLQTTSFSQRLWISTTNKWGANATEAIKNQSPPVIRLNLYELQESAVDWEKLDQGIHGEASRTPKKTVRPHQQEALDKTHEHFKTADRGKLIMACGTGKTFNSLRIAEHETNGKGLILFLVPSIALLGQTLREWSSDANEPINAVCICSDSEVSRKKSKNEDSDSYSIVDLALPASTDVSSILRQFKHIEANGHAGLTVVFSTYQSIAVIARAQAELLKSNKSYGEFDLIIVDGFTVAIGADFTRIELVCQRGDTQIRRSRLVHLGQRALVGLLDAEGRSDGQIFDWIPHQVDVADVLLEFGTAHGHHAVGGRSGATRKNSGIHW